MRTFGAVVLDQHRLVGLLAPEDQRRVGLDHAFARAPVEEAREQPRARLAVLWPLLLARIDLPAARSVPDKRHRVEQRALAEPRPVRDIEHERVDLQVVLDVGDAVDVRRLVLLVLRVHPVLGDQVPALHRQAIVPLIAARCACRAELVDQPTVVQKAQPPPRARRVPAPPEQRHLARGQVVDVMQQRKQAAVALGDRERLCSRCTPAPVDARRGKTGAGPRRPLSSRARHGSLPLKLSGMHSPRRSFGSVSAAIMRRSRVSRAEPIRRKPCGHRA